MTLSVHRAAALSCIALAGALASASLQAQRLPLTNENGRILQLFDLRQLRNDELGRPVQPTEPSEGRANAGHAATMLRHFVEPPLRPGDDLCRIGDHWLAVLADAERIACVERLFQAARERRNDLLTIEVRIVDVTGPEFDEQLKPKLVAVERAGGTSFETVIGTGAAAAFLQRLEKASDSVLSAPRISVLPLQRASVDLINQVPYVKDFEVEVTAHAAIADPVVGTVWEGNRNEVSATFLPGGRIGLSCDVQFQELHRPIPELETTVFEGAKSVTIQLPRTSGVRVANVAEVESGALVVLAARRHNGNFMVAVITAKAVPAEKGAARLR